MKPSMCAFPLSDFIWAKSTFLLLERRILDCFRQCFGESVDQYRSKANTFIFTDISHHIDRLLLRHMNCYHHPSITCLLVQSQELDALTSLAPIMVAIVWWQANPNTGKVLMAPQNFELSWRDKGIQRRSRIQDQWGSIWTQFAQTLKHHLCTTYVHNPATMRRRMRINLDHAKCWCSGYCKDPNTCVGRMIIMEIIGNRNWIIGDFWHKWRQCCFPKPAICWQSQLTVDGSRGS